METSIVLPSTDLFTSTVSPKILQWSSSSSLEANLDLEGVAGGESYGQGLGADDGSVSVITVDTTPPEVDASKGVTVSGDGDGTYVYGDTVFITVW